MSKYTTEVRYICEYYAGLEESKGFDEIETIIEESRSHIFTAYPIFDETYRKVLETKILMHYYTREICEETVGLWKLRLAARMNEIMPKYNKLYLSERFEYNPLYDVDVTTTHTKDGETVGSDVGTTQREENGERDSMGNSAKSTSDINSSNRSENNDTTYIENTNGKVAEDGTQNKLHWNKYSDTPQGYIANIDNDTYLTNATKETAADSDTANTRSNYSKGSTTLGGNSVEVEDKNSKSETGSTNNSESSTTIGNEKRTNSNMVNSTEEYAERVVGKRGGITYAKMVEEYRNTLLNIDLMVINELKDLFFGLW